MRDVLAVLEKAVVVLEGVLMVWRLQASLSVFQCFSGFHVCSAVRFCCDVLLSGSSFQLLLFPDNLS